MATLATTPPAATATPNASQAASVWSSLVGTNSAAAGAYVPPFSSYSQANAPVTVTYNGAIPSGTSSTSSDADSTSGLLSGWNKLSDTTKYAIYGGAAAVAILIITIITVICVRRSRRKKREADTEVRAKNMARMTQRSSFASPMGNMDTFKSGELPPSSSHTGSFTSLPPFGNAPGMSRTETNNSMDKNRYAVDNYSVHSIPPQYANGNTSQHALVGQEQSYDYPPRSTSRMSPPTSPQYSDSNYGGQGYQQHQQRANPYAAFAGDQQDNYASGYGQQQQQHYQQQQGYFSQPQRHQRDQSQQGFGY